MLRKYRQLAEKIENKIKEIPEEHFLQIKEIINKDVYLLAEKNEKDYRLAYYLAKVFQDILKYKTLNYLENIVLNSKNTEYNMLFAENISNCNYEQHKMVVNKTSYLNFEKILKNNYKLENKEIENMVNKYFDLDNNDSSNISSEENEK